MQLEHRAIVVERNEFASVIQDRTGVPSLLKTAKLLFLFGTTFDVVMACPRFLTIDRSH